MTHRRRNFNKPVVHRAMRGPPKQYDQRFLLPKELHVSICYALYGIMTMQEAKELRLPVPIPIIVRSDA